LFSISSVNIKNDKGAFQICRTKNVPKVFVRKSWFFAPTFGTVSTEMKHTKMTTLPPAATDIKHKRMTWSIIVILLLLRIPYTLAIIYFLPVEDQSGSAVYEVGTYLLLALLIACERNTLHEYHLDFPALLMFMALRPAQTLILAYWGVESPMAFPNVPSLAICGTSILLALSLWRGGYQPFIAPNSTRWILVGICVGAGLSIAENLPAFRSTLSGAASFSPGIFLPSRVRPHQ
jgi:hypothetical protein